MSKGVCPSLGLHLSHLKEGRVRHIRTYRLPARSAPKVMKENSERKRGRKGEQRPTMNLAVNDRA